MVKAVSIGCPCPGTPHSKGDKVTFRETMPFRSVAAMRFEIGQLGSGANYADILGLLSELYLVHGIESWTLVDADGPVGVSRDAVETYILSRYDTAADLSEFADDLYTESVVLPLVNRASTSSPLSPTDESTSPPSASSTPSSPNPTPSKRSSTSTTPTDVIAKTSPLRDGDSSSSQKAASAA